MGMAKGVVERSGWWARLRVWLKGVAGGHG